MNEVLRIISLVFKLRNSNLRYKIAYLRIAYPNYDRANGDEIDQAIFNDLNQKDPSQIRWEFANYFNSNTDLSIYLNTFTSKTLPLNIRAHVDFSSATPLELDTLRTQIFPNYHTTINLFHRNNINKDHENWLHLPSYINIDIDYRIYENLSTTIHSLQL